MHGVAGCLAMKRHRWLASAMVLTAGADFADAIMATYSLLFVPRRSQAWRTRQLPNRTSSLGATFVWSAEQITCGTSLGLIAYSF
jgi:hypothetical protein